MDFKTIDKSNYRECMELQVEESQKYFVADNTRSLVEAAYEDGLYTLGVYDGDTMVGFVLYDYDDTYPGWSMSRFMIGRQFQGKGYGKRAVREFLDYFNGSFLIISKRNTAQTEFISAYLSITPSHAKCTRISAFGR